jgi:hypothetical protein
MEKPKRSLQASKLNHISQKFVPDDQLQDTPARLFRRLIVDKLQMNPRKWTNYLRDYLDWMVTTSDPLKAKADRITRAGNIKDTYFQKPTLTFNKFLEGLSILRMESCEIQVTVKDTEGNEYVVSEKIMIVGKDRLRLPRKEDPPPES